jgi:hypothetical protein
MAALPGALLAMWIAACILIAIFLTVAAISCLVCTVSPAGTNLSRIDAFTGFIPCFLLAGLFYIHIGYLLGKSQETPETPRTRDILLTVPEESSVNAQVTSGNNTVNIQNL